MVHQYTRERKGEEDRNGKPRKFDHQSEAALLRRAYNLALEDERLSYMPSFKQVMLPEGENVREGF